MIFNNSSYEVPQICYANQPSGHASPGCQCPKSNQSLLGKVKAGVNRETGFVIDEHKCTLKMVSKHRTQNPVPCSLSVPGIE